MRYHEILSESLVGRNARPYPYEFVQSKEEVDGLGRKRRTIYTFSSDNGLIYYVHCADRGAVLDVSFTTTGGKKDLNGAGDAFRVLATVASIVKAYVEAHQPDLIAFTASRLEPSRVKLYDRLAHEIDSLIPGYRLKERKPLGRCFEYFIERVDGREAGDLRLGAHS